MQLTGKELTWDRALWVGEMSGRHTLLRSPGPETTEVRTAGCPLMKTSICPGKKDEIQKELQTKDGGKYLYHI